MKLPDVSVHLYASLRSAVFRWHLMGSRGVPPESRLERKASAVITRAVGGSTPPLITSRYQRSPPLTQLYIKLPNVSSFNECIGYCILLWDQSQISCLHDNSFILLMLLALDSAVVCCNPVVVLLLNVSLLHCFHSCFGLGSQERVVKLILIH